jgi:hypothetical protein
MKSSLKKQGAKRVWINEEAYMVCLLARLRQGYHHVSTQAREVAELQGLSIRAGEAGTGLRSLLELLDSPVDD